jgi:hypothetical protein
VEPSNDHERVIAKTVDRFYNEGEIRMAKIADAVGFVMSKDDWKFLVHYIQWRMEHSIVK